MNRSSKLQMRPKQPDPRQSGTYEKSKAQYIEAEARSPREMVKSPRSPKEPGAGRTPKEAGAKRSEPGADAHNHVHTSAHLVNATYVATKNSDSKELHRDVRFKHRKRLKKGRKEPGKEEGVAPDRVERAKEEH